MSESKEARLLRAEAASNCIVEHPIEASFNDLIKFNVDKFSGFRLIYSTNNLDADFKELLLSEIEDRCPAINRYFYGTGLHFYSDSLYQELQLKNTVEFPLMYSISFDTQVAEAFRLYESDKQISKWDWFESLVRTQKSLDLNFDYTFYLLEDLIHSLDTSNERPFDTIRALKRYDNLNFDAFKLNPKLPIFNESREDAGKRAIETLYRFQNSDGIKRSLIRRKGMKLVLMKAMQLRWLGKRDYYKSLAEMVEYSVSVLGKLGKTELYFAWKLLKSAHLFDFFTDVAQPTNIALHKINGISWDLYSLRHQETMASFSKEGDFYVPFIASFDLRFKSLIKACPLRCLLIDDRDGRLNLIFLDELDFFKDINQALNPNIRNDLASIKNKLTRLSNPLDEDKIDSAIADLENVCRALIK